MLGLVATRPHSLRSGLMPPANAPDLSLTEWAVLALIAEKPTYGWAVAKELTADGDLGRIWTVPHPVVYHALRRLEQLGVIEPLGAETSTDGPVRTVLGTTRAGRVAVDRWLSVPSSHVRELRTRLLLQLRFLDRRGLDLLPLATAQLEQLTPSLAALRDHADVRTGFAGLLARWRYESTDAAARFLESVIDQQPNRPTRRQAPTAPRRRETGAPRRLAERTGPEGHTRRRTDTEPGQAP
jgi:DNA-binding PadR family transcriptional regulator